MSQFWETATVDNTLGQRFSTWGRRTPRGTWEAHRGAPNFKNHPKQVFLIWGVREGVQSWLGGAGVPKEGWNPCSRGHESGGLTVDVEWRISRAHAFSVRGPGFDPTPKPRMAFFRNTLNSLLSDNGLKNFKIMWCRVEKKTKHSREWVTWVSSRVWIWSFFTQCLSCFYVRGIF